MNQAEPSTRKPNAQTHGMSKTSEFRSWQKMLARCTNPNEINFHRYGGRGITVCPEWMSFENFFRDMGLKPSPAHSIERRNNLLGYSKSNCVWATRIEQAQNKRNNRIVEFQNQQKPLAAWCRAFGLKYRIVRQRIIRGWTAEKALTTATK